MSRLKIIIPPEKKYLCGMLYEKFPLFTIDMSTFDGPTTFIATLLPDHDYTKDITWCTRCGLQVYTEQQDREQLIRAFLKEAVIEKMPVTSIQFLGIDHTLPGFFKVLVTLSDSVEITLHFPQDWRPNS